MNKNHRINSEIIIVGAGVIGLCTAYALQKLGYAVSVLEKETEGSTEPCSIGNAGMIVPSHLVPLANPKAVRQGLKWLFNPESPFSIDFKWSLDLYNWLWTFRKSAHKTHVKKATHILRNLGLRSRRLYTEMNREINLGLETKGVLILCETSKGFEEEALVAEAAQSLGIRAKILSSKEMKTLEPGIEIAGPGGVFYPDDAHLNPDRFMKTLKEYLMSIGVQFCFECEVIGFETEDKNIDSVITTLGKIDAESFVLSAGVHSAKVLKPLKIDLPLLGGKGYSFTLTHPPKQPKIPALLSEARAAVTPLDSGFRIGGTLTVTTGDKNIQSGKTRGLIKSISRYYPEFEPEWVETHQPWVGLRPLSADGLPYIGSLEHHPNLIIATGHGMLGMSLGPITGEVVAQMISGIKPDFDLNPLSPNRF